MLRSRFCLLLLLCHAFPVHAVELLQGRIASITAEDWTISGFEASVDLRESSLQGSVRIALLELPAAGLSFADLRVDCGSVVVSATEFGCPDAQVTLEAPGGIRQAFHGQASYERRSGITRFDFRDVSFAGGRVGLRGAASETAIDIAFSGQALQLAELAAVAGRLGASGMQNLAAAGTAIASGSLHMRDGSLARAALEAELENTSVSNEAGTLVTDGVHGFVDLEARMQDGRWQFELGLSADTGEAYAEPVYANLTEDELSFRAKGSAAPDLGEVDLTTFRLTQGTLIDAAGKLRLSRAGDESTRLSGAIELTDSSVEAIYSGLLQVLLTGTIVGDLETSGTIAGTVTVDDNTLSGLQLSLHDVSAADRQERFSVDELNGIVRWPGPDGEVLAEPTTLRWASASAYSIPLGASEMEIELGADDVRLLKALRVPTMGGALVIHRLSVTNFGKDDASGLLDAELEPIQLAALTGAFGWPAFSGTLSGQLPLLRYDGGTMTVGGTLTANAFDGDIEFANLRVEEPFGLVPRLYGDLRLRQLDLEQLTDTFSFGLIQGRLSGDVTGLVMHSWQPVAMDLHLYTPPGDARRRISQRAVENLASVGGGGAAAALSSGFMKFFEEFSYQRIGIRCILQNGTCSMSGAGPAGESDFGQGYYIVKGSGLPRIDVIGYRHQVSWTALVDQLVNITQSGAPTVD